MTHHVPGSLTDLLALAERRFEEYLPSDSTGYIRELTPADASHWYYTENGYGFFDSAGNLLGSAVSREDVAERVHQEGFRLFSIH